MDDMDHLCQGPIQGFKVVLHPPSEVPQPSKNFFRVPLEQVCLLFHIFCIEQFQLTRRFHSIFFLLEQQVLVSVKPNVLVTAEELKDYKPHRKLCYMNSDSPLKFYKVYTQHHCELECTSKFMNKGCGCVYFSYPSNTNTRMWRLIIIFIIIFFTIKGDKTTPICGAHKLKCVAAIEEEMMVKIFLDSLHDVNSEAQTCKCLPSCNSANYDIEISSTKYDSAKYFRAFELPLLGLSK